MTKLVIRATAEAFQYLVTKKDNTKMFQALYEHFGEYPIEYTIATGLELLLENKDHDIAHEALVTLERNDE